MKKDLYRFLSFVSILSLTFSLPAQDNLPTDYLSKEFHAGRREALRKLMPDNSVFVVMAYPTRTFSNDVEYLYHQNPDMYYFSGYKEPHSVLLIFKEDQKGSDGGVYKELIFVQKKNALAEQWTGRRLGTEGAKEKLGFTYAYNGEGTMQPDWRYRQRGGAMDCRSKVESRKSKVALGVCLLTSAF